MYFPPVYPFLLFSSSFLFHFHLLNHFSILASQVFSPFRLYLIINFVLLFLLITLSVSFPLSHSLLFRLSFLTIFLFFLSFRFPFSLSTLSLPLFINFSLSLFLHLCACPLILSFLHLSCICFRSPLLIFSFFFPIFFLLPSFFFL